MKPFAQAPTPNFRKRPYVRRGRPLPSKERLPIIVEVRKFGNCVNSLYYDCAKIGIDEKLFECFWAAQWEALSFIQPAGVGVKGRGGLPEMSYQFHLLGIIPYVRSNGSVGTCDTCHLKNAGMWIRDKVENEARYDYVKRRIEKRHGSC